MSLPDEAEIWWPTWALPKDKKEKTAEQIKAAQIRHDYNKAVRKQFKKEHPEMTRLQIIEYASSIGGYKAMEKLLKTPLPKK